MSVFGELTQVSANKCFGGVQKVFSHDSVEVRCNMKFGVYLPPQAIAQGAKCPVLYFLSGLTCTEANFIQKSGFQRYAAEHGIIVVNPDTSPRGCNIEGEDESWDFGTGAGFYVDATVEKFMSNYRMYSYVTKELPAVVNATFPVIPDRQGIFGHSMGGHGALVCALRNPDQYKSVSAFAPISNPMDCPWGHKCFTGYLGPDTTAWEQYDATHLIKAYSGNPMDILVDQGDQDDFLEGQLKPQNLVKASRENEKVKISLRLLDGYDHSYYFISSFMADHFNHHASKLKTN